MLTERSLIMPLTMTPAEFETALSEFEYSERVYKEKLASMIAAAKAILAASTQDGQPQKAADRKFKNNEADKQKLGWSYDWELPAVGTICYLRREAHVSSTAGQSFLQRTLSCRFISRVPSPLAAYRMPACHGRRTDCLPVLPPASAYARRDHRRRRNTRRLRAW